MNLLQVSPYTVHPPDDGGSHRSHGLVSGFHDRGDDVVRYVQGGSYEIRRQGWSSRRVTVGEQYVEYRDFNPLHDVVKAPVALGYPNVLVGKTLRVVNDRLPRYLTWADVVLVREPWQVPTILEMTDTPVVFSSHNVEAERFEPEDGGPCREWAYRRALEAERIAVTQTDAVVCVSDRDRELYRDRHGETAPIHVLPNGTYESDIRRHTPDAERAQRVRRRYGIAPETPLCTFVGSRYGPNNEAARDVVRIASDDRLSDVHFLLVGTVCDAIDAERPNVTLAGFVDDFEAHLDATDVALNPMSSGAGTNIKLLDYFARSLPVVSTPFGVRGVDVEPGTHAVVREIESFPDGIRTLVDDDASRRAIGENARELVRRKYTWEQASHDLQTLVDDVVTGSASASL